ncbi:hypothetical protein [Nisaea sediminum]|uniref:hypothetical protein n=1 Tax=Nisaea sediminum TaxID=2775867 RepID=UPI0018690D8B|nr:hypothetical protein [Nisaea sediminum]
MHVQEIPTSFYRSIYQTSENVYLSRSAEAGSGEELTGRIDDILDRRLATTGGLSLSDAAELLLLVREHPLPEARKAVKDAARALRHRTFGHGVATMVPIEVTSFCSSTCRFCGWRADNKAMARMAITGAAIREQAKVLAAKGFSHFEIAGGDDLKFLKDNLAELIRGLKQETSAVNPDARVSLCLVPMHQEHYEALRDDGLDCVLTWQETYKEDLYNHHIPAGPKAWGIDHDLRLQKKNDNSVGWLHRMQSQELAIRAGLQAGLGTMIGLAEIAEADILSVIMHGQKLIEHYADTIQPLIIGMPAWNAIPTEETDRRATERPPFEVEQNFELLSAIYLLAFPDNHAWVFANGRVNPTVQTDCVETASFFTSTLVQIAPGAYLGLDGNKVPRDMFDRVRGLPDGALSRDEILSGEQFVHYLDSHENFVAGFEARGMNVIPDRAKLLHADPPHPAVVAAE